MMKKLTKHGNSHALVIDKAILELLEIDEETWINISTDGESLVLTPIKDEQRRAKVRKSVANMNLKYGKAFKRLAEH